MVWRDDLVWVKHVVDRAMPVPLGHLVVETARHTAYVDSLSDDEAAALGVARRRAAVALRAELDVDAVHAYLSNRSLEHVHERLIGLSALQTIGLLASALLDVVRERAPGPAVGVTAT